MELLPLFTLTRVHLLLFTLTRVHLLLFTLTRVHLLLFTLARVHLLLFSLTRVHLLLLSPETGCEVIGKEPLFQICLSPALLSHRSTNQFIVKTHRFICLCHPLWPSDSRTYVWTIHFRLRSGGSLSLPSVSGKYVSAFRLCDIRLPSRGHPSKPSVSRHKPSPSVSG